MAIEKTITIKGETKQASGAFSKLKEVIDLVIKAYKDADKEMSKNPESVKKVNKETKDLDKTVKKTTKSTSLLSKGFKLIGESIKATGIGLVVGVLATLAAAMSKNQEIINAVSTATETLSIYMSKVTDVLVSVYKNVSKNSENFDALGKVIGGLITVFLTPLKLAFYAIKLAISESQLLWEQSFFGGNDKEKIKELTESIEETKESIIEVGKSALEAGKDIVNNFSEAITEATDIATQATEKLSKVSLKAAYEQAKVNVELKNTAELAVAQQSRLVEIYDRQAEQARQIRDDISIGITDRIKSNEDLLDVLNKQEKAMLLQADAQIAAAQADVNKNNNIENQVALTDALANKEGVLAQVEGFRSEQLVNRIALKKELQDLDLTAYEAEQERNIKRKEFEIEQEEDELLRLEKQKELIELERELALEDLEFKKELYKEGTQARIDAEQEYLDRKQELDQSIKTNEVKTTKETEKREQNLKDFKLNLASNLAGSLQGLAKEGSAFAKGLAITQAGISTYQGINKALAETTDFTPSQSLRFANAAAVGIAGFANVANILKQGGSSSGSDSNSASSIEAPSFNIVEGTAENQISESIQSQNNEPVQAFVVSRSVTTSQELDRNIEDRATL